MYDAGGPLNVPLPEPKPEPTPALTGAVPRVHTNNVATASVAVAITIQVTLRLVFMEWSSQNMMKGMANGPAGRIHAHG
jgi:hypothetical protein